MRVRQWPNQSTVWRVGGGGGGEQRPICNANLKGFGREKGEKRVEDEMGEGSSFMHEPAIPSTIHNQEGIFFVKSSEKIGPSRTVEMGLPPGPDGFLDLFFEKKIHARGDYLRGSGSKPPQP